MTRAFAAVFLTWMSACSLDPTPPEPVAMELQAYAVPAGYGPRVVSTLNRLLRTSHEEAPVGRAAEGPGGEVLVVAPGEVQDGVARMLGSLGQGAAPPVPSNLVMSYWLVWGAPGQEGPRPARVAPIAATLDTIEQTDGPMRFEILARQELGSLEGEEASASGGRDGNGISVKQVITRNPETGALVADIEIDSHRGLGQTRTRVGLEPNQTVVLASMGSASVDGEDRVLYTILKPRVP